MKKRIFKIVPTILLIAVLAVMPFFGCTGCNGGEETPDDGHKLTDILLYKNDASFYKIVVPQNAGETELFAAEELKNFFDESTGFSLPVITDEGLSFNENSFYLSIGDTAIYRGSGVTAEAAELGRDGYKVVNKKRTVIMKGGGERGTLYAVYKFMNYSFGFKVYAVDEIKVDKKSEMYLPEFNLTDIPDIPERSPGNMSIQYGPIHAYRMRTEQKKDNWAIWSHSDFRILGTAAKDEWLNGAKTQLCMTRDVGDLDKENTATDNLRYAYVESLKNYIIGYKNAAYIMLGQEDRNVFCTCKSCTESNALYGGPSGTRQRFVNAVARDIKAWLDTADPDRDITLVTFAYMRTFVPPVTKNSFGDYVAADASVIPEPNTAILIAPLYEPCFAHSIHEDCNVTVKEAFLGWKSLTDNIMCWTYSTDFTANFMPFGDYSSWQTNYQFYKELGIKFFYDQCTEYATTVFTELRAYLHAEAMWDVNVDQNKLTKDFMDNYYKDAAPYILEYYELIRTRYAVMDQEKKDADAHFNVEPYSERNGAYLTSEQYWPLGYVLQSVELLEKAMDAAKAHPDVEVREKLIARVKLESLSPRYLQLQLFGSLYNAESAAALIDSFEQDCVSCGIVNYNQQDAISIAERIASWRQKYVR